MKSIFALSLVILTSSVTHAEINLRIDCANLGDVGVQQIIQGSTRTEISAYADLCHGQYLTLTAAQAHVQAARAISASSFFSSEVSRQVLEESRRLFPSR